MMSFRSEGFLPSDGSRKRQRRFSAKAENRGVVVIEVGSYLRLIDYYVTQLKAQGPSRTCNESKEDEEVGYRGEFDVSNVLQERRVLPERCVLCQR